MGRVIAFTGQAGTGKTYSLMQRLRELIPQREWFKFETILALTFMHGSRKRLDSNLKFVKNDFHVRYECSTIDSFALNILNRFRSYIDVNKIIRPSEDVSENEIECFYNRETIREKAVQLFQFESVRKFISNSYPYIIIDEFQDCDGSLLEIIKQLSLSTDLLIASDQFQQLYNPENLDGLQWINENRFEHIDLNSSGIKRTNNNKILLSAASLRIGILQSGKKIDVFPCPSSKSGSIGLAAYHLKTQIHYLLAQGNIAIISPTQNDPFVKAVLSSLSEHYTYRYPPNKTIGPYNHLLSYNNSTNIEEILNDIPQRPITKDDLKEFKRKKDFILTNSSDRILRKLSIRNLDEISYNDFCYVVEQTGFTFDNFYRRENNSKLIFTTIHGAKNREFDNVIILWSYRVSGNLLYKRKLLYNAITRAKKNVAIIVQHRIADRNDLADNELFSLIIDKEEVKNTTA
jgi:superfamily I DNA and RNA helicase